MSISRVRRQELFKNFDTKMLKFLDNNIENQEDFKSIRINEDFLYNFDANAQWNEEFFNFLQTMNDLADIYSGMNDNDFLRKSLHKTLFNSIRLALTFASINQHNAPSHIERHLEPLKSLNSTLVSAKDFIEDQYNSDKSTALFNNSQKLLKATDYGYNRRRLMNIALGVTEIILYSTIALIAVGVCGISLTIPAFPFLLTFLTGLSAAVVLGHVTVGIGRIAVGVSSPFEKDYAENIANSLANECGVSKTGFFGGKTLVKPLETRYEANDNVRNDSLIIPSAPSY